MGQRQGLDRGFGEETAADTCAQVSHSGPLEDSPRWWHRRSRGNVVKPLSLTAFPREPRSRAYARARLSDADNRRDAHGRDLVVRASSEISPPARGRSMRGLEGPAVM